MGFRKAPSHGHMKSMIVSPATSWACRAPPMFCGSRRHLGKGTLAVQPWRSAIHLFLTDRLCQPPDARPVSHLETVSGRNPSLKWHEKPIHRKIMQTSGPNQLFE
jgi:hypothetical protein